MKQILKNIAAVYLTKRSRKHNSTIDELEYKQIDTTKKSYADSVYFSGISNEGFCFVTRQSFYADKPNENWLKVNIPGEGVWGFENLQLDEGNGFQQGSLEYICDKPGKEWRITFEGNVVQESGENQIKLQINWISATPIALLDETGETDLQIGKQLAKEDWTIHYLNKIRKLDIEHYEQAGKMTGLLEWKGKIYTLDFAGFRYHSKGVQNWSELDSNLWISALLEDGRYFSLRLTDYIFVKNLQSAFMYDDDRFFTIYSIPPLEQFDLEKLLAGPFSIPLQEVSGGPIKQLSVEMLNEFPYQVHPEYFLLQAEATFDYDGVKGIGIIEFGAKTKYFQDRIGD